MDGKSSEEEHVPNKAEFVDQLANRLNGDRKRAAAALDAVIENIYDAISRGERVSISGFGVFERRNRAARMGRNPATGEPVQVPASRVPAFRPGERFRKVAKGEDGAAKSTSKKSAAKKSAAKKSTAKKSSPARKATASKSAAKKSTAKKSTAKKSTAKKSTKKAAAKKR